MDGIKFTTLCCREVAAAGIDRRALDRHAEDVSRGQVEAVRIQGLDHEEDLSLAGDALALEEMSQVWCMMPRRPVLMFLDASELLGGCHVTKI